MRDFDIAVKRAFPQDPGIVTVEPITGTPKTITLVGHKVGTATIDIEYTDKVVDTISANVTK